MSDAIAGTTLGDRRRRVRSVPTPNEVNMSSTTRALGSATGTPTSSVSLAVTGARTSARALEERRKTTRNSGRQDRGQQPGGEPTRVSYENSLRKVRQPQARLRRRSAGVHRRPAAGEPPAD